MSRRSTVHLHASAESVRHAQSSADPCVEVEVDLRRLDQATAGPAKSITVRSVMLTTPANTERKSRDTAAEESIAVDIGCNALSTGQVDLTIGSPNQANTYGTNMFANTVVDRNLADTPSPESLEYWSYDYYKNDNNAKVFDLVTNLVSEGNYKEDTTTRSVVNLLQYEADTKPVIYVLGLGPKVRYADYAYAVADGQQVRLSAVTDNFELPPTTATLPQMTMKYTITQEQQTITQTIRSVYLYARNVTIPTQVENLKGTRALMFFGTFAAATASYSNDTDMVSAAINIGKTAFTETQRQKMNYAMPRSRVKDDGFFDATNNISGHFFTIMNHSILTIPLALATKLDAKQTGVFPLMYVGSHPPTAKGGVYYAKRLTQLDKNYSSGARVVLFETEEEANKDDYTVYNTTTDPQRVKEYACAAAALRLIQPAADEFAPMRHAFMDPPTSALATYASPNSVPYVDIAGGGTSIKLPRPVTSIRSGDAVVLQTGDAWRLRWYKYPEAGHFTHLFDTAPNGEADFTEYTGLQQVGPFPVEGPTAVYYARVSSDGKSIQLCTTRAAAVAEHTVGDNELLRLSDWRIHRAAKAADTTGSDAGRFEMKRHRAPLGWHMAYIELLGFSAGSGGVISNDPHMSCTGNHVVPVSRSNVNNHFYADYQLPVDAIDRKGGMRIWVTDMSQRRRAPLFPADIERIDVTIEVEHRGVDNEDKSRARYEEFINRVIMQDDSGDRKRQGMYGAFN